MINHNDTKGTTSKSVSVAVFLRRGDAARLTGAQLERKSIRGGR
jgi:hypothetical protein